MTTRQVEWVIVGVVVAVFGYAWYQPEGAKRLWEMGRKEQERPWFRRADCIDEDLDMSRWRYGRSTR